MSREEKILADREKVTEVGFWLYNDLDRAFEEGRKTGKPVLVSLRCVPCEECVKLDDDLVDNDPVIRPLLEKFVCVRVVGTNGLDLDTFQYDTDQSFAMFMMNADKTIYGRFGTRSHRTEWYGDVSLPGMAAALQAALKLHAQYPNNKSMLASKRGDSLEFARPEKYPSLAKKYTDRLDYEGDVVASCIHCHQIGDARRDYHWGLSKAMPEKLLFPYPHPKSIGLVLDPKTCATVKSVAPNTPASESGLREGDEILMLGGQPLISMADVQWVLHHADSNGDALEMLVRRGGRMSKTKLNLPEGWRTWDDPSWRVSSWGLCRMVLGGMRLETLGDDERSELGIEGDGMALRVKVAGRYGAHGLAKRSGFQIGDIVLSYDGKNDLPREADVFAYATRQRKPGNMVAIELLREGRRITKQLKLQK